VLKFRFYFHRADAWVGWRLYREARTLLVQPLPFVGLEIKRWTAEQRRAEVDALIDRRIASALAETRSAVYRLRVETGLEEAGGFMCDSRLLDRLRAVEVDVERTREEDYDRAPRYAGTSRLRKRFAEIVDRLQAVAVVAERADVLCRSWGDAKLLSRVAELEDFRKRHADAILNVDQRLGDLAAGAANWEAERKALVARLPPFDVMDKVREIMSRRPKPGKNHEGVTTDWVESSATVQAAAKMVADGERRRERAAAMRRRRDADKAAGIIRTKVTKQALDARAAKGKR